MSDLCMYELGDIGWDEFCDTEDHIVPHPIGEEASDHSFLGDSHKKPVCELIGLSGPAGEFPTNKSVHQEKKQETISFLDDRRKIMLEKESWSHTPNGVFPSLHDSNSVKDVSSLVPDGATASSHSFESRNIGSDYCTTDSIVTDKSAADDNSFNYPLGHITQTDNDMSFFDNESNDKDSGDFIYYGWPDIGNFEDVDRMFRSCDSTFGLGSSNEDEFGWFASSDTIEGSGDMLMSEMKIPCPSSIIEENHLGKNEPVRANSFHCSINDSSLENALVGSESNSWLSDKDDPDNLGQLSFVNATNSSDKKVDFRTTKKGVELQSEVLAKISSTSCSTNGTSEMTNAHKKQQKHQNKYETKKKDSHLGHGGSFHYDVCLTNAQKDLPSKAASSQILSSGGIHQQKQDLGPESFGYLQNSYPYLQSDYSHSSDQTSTFPIVSPVKSDNHGYRNISPMESYSSNQVVSAQSIQAPAFQVTPAVPSEKMEKLHHRQALPTYFNSKRKDGEMWTLVPSVDQGSVEKGIANVGKQVENHTDGERSPGEFGSAVQESSSESSGFDEVSLEATSFHQLQLVMEQLDLKTKLCIRDSLYRLARSAEQRHNNANMKGSYHGDGRDAAGNRLPEGTNKCAGPMDIETDTNPIDRSIAHLLFHRPDSSVIPARDSGCYKSPAQIHGSASTPPVLTENSSNKEAMAAEMGE